MRDPATLPRLFSVAVTFLTVLVVTSSLPLHGADCNGNGREDSEDLTLAESEDCNANGVPDECDGAPVVLTLGEELFEAPAIPFLIAEGDLDGDGDPDLVRVTRDARLTTLGVFFNEGNRALVERGVRSSDILIHAIALGDLDGDGVLDLAAVGEGEASREPVLAVYFNDGAGGLGEAVRYGHPVPSHLVTLADLDGDDFLDIVLANRRETTVTVRTNDGQGNFSDGRDFQIGDNPRGLDASDFDGDGDLDLATVNLRSADLTVILNESSGSAGIENVSFSAPASYPIGGTFPRGIASADVNGDQRPDVVALTTRQISVFLNLGDGAFSEAATFLAADTTVLSMFDADGDSDLDVLLAGSTSGLVVHVNDGTGDFRLSVDFASLPISPVALAISDYDLDGDADVAFGSLSPKAVQVLWNGDEQSELAVRRDVIDLSDGRCHRELGCRPHSAQIADFDGDSDLDFVVGIPWPASFTFLRNEDGQLFAQDNESYGPNQALSMDQGDLNGDEIIDLATVDSTDYFFRVHLGDGTGSFETVGGSTGGVPAGIRPVSIKLADLDGDDDLDAVAAADGVGTVSFLFNDGEGVFERREDATRSYDDPLAVDAADFDGDGFPEVVVAVAGKIELRILVNAGDGTFPDVGVRYPLSHPPGSLVIADMDGQDGLDVVVATGGARVSILLNRGGGSFDRAESFTTGQAALFVNKVDFNSDGDMDVVTANEIFGTVSVLIGNGDGTLRQPRVFEGGDGLRFVYTGDVDLDGDDDLVTANRREKSVTVLYNESETAQDVDDFAESLCTAADFHPLSSDASSSGARFVKFTLPVGQGLDHLAGPVFQNTEKFPLHELFLSKHLPDQFAGFTPQEYTNLVGVRSTRQYFVGAITRLPAPQGYTYGFSVFALWGDPEEQLAASEVKAIYDNLRGSFTVEPFAYFPNSRSARDVATAWGEDPGFPILSESVEPTGPPYEAYTRGIGYGVVRILDAQAFASANDRGEFSFQNILVLDEAPRDINGVVSAACTAEPQGELSHLAVRMARRGSPNFFSVDVLERLEPFDGKLVRLEVNRSGYDVEEATLEDAEAWWEATRPSLSVPPTIDPDFTELATFAEIAALDDLFDNGGAPFSVVARFGGKASGLARLQTILDGPFEEYREAGFAIPMHYYLEFMRSNRIPSEVNGDLVTYEQYLEELFGLPNVQADSGLRLQALNLFRVFARDFGEIPGSLVTMLADRIEEVFGSRGLTVRFRSSSNVEDSLEFNGAGLYESTSVCVLDSFDGDGNGPSLCDAEKQNERTIERAVKKVWTSLWTYRAHEERSFFGIAPDLVVMGILVNRAFLDERANGVAFTGNPSDVHDRRQLITAQLGEVSVVSPGPGILAEKNFLEIENGQVVDIVRSVSSSLMPPGAPLLSDEELDELGALLSHIDQNYPVESGEYPREQVLLDTEFKIEANGDLAIKQIRPFLITDLGPPPPTFELVIPEGTMACGRFEFLRTVHQEYELKSMLRFAAGTVLLPAASDTFSADIVEELIVGPEREVAVPESGGLFRVEDFVRTGGEIVYRFEFEQRFTLADGKQIALTLSGLEYKSLNDEPVELSRVFNDGLLAEDSIIDESSDDGVFLRGRFEGDNVNTTTVYSSCTDEDLPLWEVRAELADGTSIVLEERYLEELNKNFGPASLRSAALDFSGRHREVGDFFELVYSALKHNDRAIYWAVLEPPMVLNDLEAPVSVVALHAPGVVAGTGPKAFYLGEDLNVLREVEVVFYDKQEGSDRPPAPFRRGDVDASGRLNLTDAIALVRYLFAGVDAPVCVDATDANDDGNLDLSDTIAILLYLFADREALSAPFGNCGADPTTDGLGCDVYPACE